MNKRFFILSFLPALAYWYLEENYSVQVAASGGILLAVIEILLEKIFLKHIHKISWFNFSLIGILGALSLLGEEGIWFKLQPSFTGIFMGGLILFYQIRGRGIFLEMVQEIQSNTKALEFFPKLESHLGLFFLSYGIFMGVVSFNLSTSQWLFYKTIGFYIALFVFFALEIVLMRRRILKAS